MEQQSELAITDSESFEKDLRGTKAIISQMRTAKKTHSEIRDYLNSIGRRYPVGEGDWDNMRVAHMVKVYNLKRLRKTKRVKVMKLKEPKLTPKNIEAPKAKSFDFPTLILDIQSSNLSQENKEYLTRVAAKDFANGKG